MSLLKSAALFVVTVGLVAGTLNGVHAQVHVAHIRPAARKVPGIALLGSYPRKNREVKAFAWNKRSRPFATRVANAFSAEDGDRIAAIQQTAADTMADRQPPSAPRPLPAPANAVPLPPAAEDWPPPNGPPSGESYPSAPPPSSPHAPSSSGRRLIDKALPNSSAEERDLWHETTKDLPLNDLRELLRLRAQIGRLSPAWSDLHRSPNQQATPSPGSPMPGSGPFYSAPNDGTGPAGGGPDPGRLLSETMTAMAQARQVLLNNIANAQTNGFKRRLILFESASDRPMTSSSSENPFQIGFGFPVEVGARLSPVVCDMAPGRLTATHRSLDLAIEGQGFFHLVDGHKKREVYTRRGRFTVNKAGQLSLAATSGEWILEPPVTIPSHIPAVEISSDGQVRGWDAEKHATSALGSLQTACFPASSLLLPDDGTFFLPPEGVEPDVKSPGISGHGLVRQGALEESNVDVKHELDELARLGAQLQALEQATRLMQPGGLDRPAGPNDAGPLAPSGVLR